MTMNDRNNVFRQTLRFIIEQGQEHAEPPAWMPQDIRDAIALLYGPGCHSPHVLKRRLGRLPAHVRRVVVMRYVDRLSAAAIAERTGLLPATIEAYIQRAIVQFREEEDRSIENDPRLRAALERLQAFLFPQL